MRSVQDPEGPTVPDVARAIEREVAVPLVRRGRQGDVLVVPWRVAGAVPWPTYGREVESLGVVLLGGVGGGHAHVLVAIGSVSYTPIHRYEEVDERLPIVGAIEVAPESAAYLIHPEHRALGVAPGRYAVLRQREFDGFETYPVLD